MQVGGTGHRKSSTRAVRRSVKRSAHLRVPVAEQKLDRHVRRGAAGALGGGAGKGKGQQVGPSEPGDSYRHSWQTRPSSQRLNFVCVCVCVFNLNSFTEEAGREHFNKIFPCPPESQALSLQGFVGELAGSPSARGGHGEEQGGVMAVAALLI